VTSRRPKPCVVCGRRVDDGQSRCPAHQQGGARPRPCLVCARPSQGNYCHDHEPTVDEAVRNERNPYRQAYKAADYARNRQHRFERARGRCEDCGLPCGPGEWECDHVLSARDWVAQGRPGSPNSVENLRIRCIVPRPGAPRGCHGVKTAATRRARRGRHA